MRFEIGVSHGCGLSAARDTGLIQFVILISSEGRIRILYFLKDNFGENGFDAPVIGIRDQGIMVVLNPLFDYEGTVTDVIRHGAVNVGLCPIFAVSIDHILPDGIYRPER